MGTDGVHRREESRVVYQYLRSPVGMRSESEERSEQVFYCGAGDETGELDLEE